VGDTTGVRGTTKVSPARAQPGATGVADVTGSPLMDHPDLSQQPGGDEGWA